MFYGAFAQDVDPIEADVMAIVQNTVAKYEINYF
jgi:hypothetical protein